MLSEHADPGWSATLSGEPLPATTYDGWAQAFELPASAGEVRITHRGPERRTWLTAQLGVVLVAVVLALPGMRRRRGAVEGAMDEGLDDTSAPDLPAVPAYPAGVRRVPVGAGAPVPAALPQRHPVPQSERMVPREPVLPPEPAVPPEPGATAAWLDLEAPDASGPGGHGRHAGRRARRGVSTGESEGAPRRSPGRGGRRAKGRRRRGGDQ